MHGKQDFICLTDESNAFKLSNITPWQYGTKKKKIQYRVNKNDSF